MTPRPTDEELAAQYVANLEAFVLRARRVAAHSLAADRKRLMAMASQMRFRFNPETGKGALIRNVPDEEILESAGARVRPILLLEDPVHWSKALKAIKFLTRGAENVDEIHGVADNFKKDWARVAPKGDPVRATIMMVQRGPGEQVFEATDTALSTAWFYGDVVHAKTEPLQNVDGFDIKDRFLAAAQTVPLAMVQTIATLNFIRDLRNKGLLSELSPEAFTKDVVVGHLEPEIQLEGAWSAPVGTPIPTGDGDLGDSWTAHMPSTQAEPDRA